MKKFNYYILGPWAESGGPEGLHQLCYELINLGKNAYMVYYDPWKDRIQKEYKDQICGRYNQYKGITSFTPNYISDIDTEDSLIVLPEVCNINHIKKFKKAKVLFLRLSNNTKETALDPYNYDSLYNPIFKTCYTGCDPFLIFNMIKNSKSYDMEKVFMLRPNINSSYITSEDELNDLKNKRKNVVMYSPARGIEHFNKIIEQSKNIDLDINIEFIPLEGMNQIELRNIMDSSKLYIELGHLPGPDRLSRECASRGSVVLLGKRGSGLDWDDFPIEEKIDYDQSNNTFDYESICHTIVDIIKNYDSYYEKQKSFREILRNEREIYINQIKKMIEVVE